VKRIRSLVTVEGRYVAVKDIKRILVSASKNTRRKIVAAIGRKIIH